MSHLFDAPIENRLYIIKCTSFVQVSVVQCLAIIRLYGV